MKKIKLKSLVDTQTDNIDDIYSNIVKELNLGTKETKNKNLDNYIKQCPKPTKPKKDEDLLKSSSFSSLCINCFLIVC